MYYASITFLFIIYVSSGKVKW